MRLCLVHNFGTSIASVGWKGLRLRELVPFYAGGLVRIAHDNDVAATAERVFEDRTWDKVHLRIRT